MSKPPRKITNNSTQTSSNNLNTENNINSVIEQVKNANNKADTLHDDLRKNAKDVAQIASLMKNYFNGKSKNEDEKDTPIQVKTNKICRVYGCIYKGTYDGIVDGLAKVEKQKKDEDKITKLDVAKGSVKLTAKGSFAIAKAIWQLPNNLRKVLINSVAWERSEVLNTFRAIKYGVGIDSSGKVDYSQKFYRQSIINNKKINLEGISLAEQQIDILQKIYESTKSQQKKDRILGLSRIIGKKDSEQIEYLKRIEDNTNRGNVKQYIIWKTLITGNKGILVTLGALGYTFAKVMGTSSGAGKLIADGITNSIDSGFSNTARSIVNLSKEIHGFSDSLINIGDGWLDSIAAGVGDIGIAVSAGLGMIGLKWAGGMFARGQRGVESLRTDLMIEQRDLLKSIDENTKVQSGKKYFGMFGKKYDGQISLLQEIRDALVVTNKTPEEKKTMWQKIKTIFGGKNKEPILTEAEKTNELLDRVVYELEYNTDYQEEIIFQMGRKFALTRLMASDNREILKHINEGITVVPYNADTLTVFESENLNYLKEIEDRNMDEVVAIGDLGKSLCNCITLEKKSSDDDHSNDIYESIEKTRQHNIEDSISNEENIRDSIKRQDDLQKTLDNIYNVLHRQTKITARSSKGAGAKSGGVIGSIVEGVDFLSDIKDSKDLLRGIKSFGRGRLPRGIRTPRIPSGAGKTAGKAGKGILSTGKGIISGAAGLGTTLTGGLGITGLLTASGSTIAGAGAGAMAGAGSLLAASGAAGYGIGTLINKGIDSTVKKLTDGDNSSLGGWIYDITHKKENDEIQKNTQKLIENNKKLAKKPPKIKETEIPTTTAASTPSIPASIKPTVETAIAQVGKGFEKGINLTKETVDGIGGSIINAVKNDGNKFSGWQESVGRGWDKTIKTMGGLSDGLDVIDDIKNSKTAAIVTQVFNNDTSSGGGSTTNINMPATANDTDRGTQHLIASLGA